MMIALVDCNNFYVSSERLFNPKLEGKPVTILTNNDGCAVARSEEAKALGIDMDTPAFMIEEPISKQITMFSREYKVYLLSGTDACKLLGISRATGRKTKFFFSVSRHKRFVATHTKIILAPK